MPYPIIGLLTRTVERDQYRLRTHDRVSKLGLPRPYKAPQPQKLPAYVDTYLRGSHFNGINALLTVIDILPSHRQRLTQSYLSFSFFFLLHSIGHPLHLLQCPLQQPHQLPRRNPELHRVLTGRKHKTIGPQHYKGLPARVLPQAVGIVV